MGDARQHAFELEELGRIDYFLDQLARAVERGEVPLSSYETLAPRYLTRREELVAIVSGARRHPAGYVPSAGSADGVARSIFADTYAEAPASAAPIRPRREREPISWTTVLLFLGAFLVIVASGIFALAVWSSTGPVFRLAFLGTLTAAFYAAGHYARTKLELRAGSAALTVVGSAMLLFDCWIVIDGWGLSGPLPWAGALFFCSAVYWFTEVRLGDRFYGIAGVAAQIAWWWLMSAGLHLEVPVRLAGVAVIALAWQLVAEKARDDSEFASLAQVLLLGAPLAVTAASIGVAYDAIGIGTSTLLAAACAAVVAGAAATVVLRTTLLPAPQRRWVAGVLQLPLFVLLLQPGPGTWVGVGGLFAVTAVYTLVALRRLGLPFAIAALGMELLAVNALLSMLKVSDPVRVGAMAALAVTWTLASRLAETLVDRSGDNGVDTPAARPAEQVAALPDPSAIVPGPVAETSNALQIGGFALLVLASAFTPTVGVGLPLLGVSVLSADAMLAVAVLVAWAASTLIRRTPVGALATALWSFYAVAAVLSWWLPALHSPYYALGLLAVAACWLAARGAMERHYDVPEEAFGWLMRGISLAILVGGLLAETFALDPTAGAMALLTGALALEFAADAALSGPAVSAAIASAAAVLAGGLAGLYPRESVNDGALAATATGAVLAVVGIVLRANWRPKSYWLAVGAAGAATVATGLGADGWPLAGALALTAVAWTAAAFATRIQYLSLPGGATIFATVVASLTAADASPWVSLGVLCVTGVVLGVPAALPETGREGGHARVGKGFALAGLLGLGYVISQVVLADMFGWVFVDTFTWVHLGSHGIAVAYVVAGAYVVAQAVLWKLEWALYAGSVLILLATCTELGAWHFTTTQLYTSAVALYLVGMGAVYVRQAPGRTVPRPLDVATVAIGMGIPALIAITSPAGSDGFTSLVWALLLALLGVGAGIAFRVKSYLFGSAGLLVIVVGWRSFAYLASVWWLVLGLVGTAMLVIALTWERQRQVLSATQQRLKDGFEHWR